MLWCDKETAIRANMIMYGNPWMYLAYSNLFWKNCVADDILSINPGFKETCVYIYLFLISTLNYSMKFNDTNLKNTTKSY